MSTAKPLSYQYDPSIQLVRTASNYSVSADSVVNSNQKVQIVNVPFETAPQASVLASAPAQIIFRMDKNMMQSQIHYLQMLTLKFNIKNTSATNALKLVDGYSLISSIDFYCGGILLQSLQGAQIRDNILTFLDADSSAVAVCDSAKIDVTTGLSTLNLAAGGTNNMDVLVDIFEAFCTVGNVPLFLMPELLEIRLTLRYGDSQCLAFGSVATTADTSLTGMQMIAVGEKLSDSALLQKIQDYKKADPVLFRFTTHNFQVINLGSVTSGVVAPSGQFNIQGSLALINPMLVNTTDTNGEYKYYNTYKINSLDFTDGGILCNHSLGNLQLTDTIFYALSSAWLGCQRTLYNYWRFYAVFSEKYGEAVKSGANWGAYNTNGSQSMQLTIIPGDTLTNAALYVYTVAYSSLILDFSSGSPRLTSFPGNIDLQNK